ncbi:hypothetical protein EK21DRAFT_107457 [Setomelanomma holmii]|uniref:NACHT domain-containing protein n=1 Tax=Setomelanomma holmii TaxID=210430 RepID=A0A9P4HI24_9PLEO|nr:hypothetical protein EK21DRAFT_107457 [Setomelanomma holmii]
MANTTAKVPGKVIVDDKNRSELQSVIQFFINSATPYLSTSSPEVTFTISARQTWSAHPARPLTVSTRHTALDAKIPDRSTPGSYLEQFLSISTSDNGWDRLTYHTSHLRPNFKNPMADDWQEELGFATIPSLQSGDAYTVDRTIRLDAFETSRVASFVPGQTLRFHLSEGRNLPGIEWWNWGALDRELKSKKLGYRGDPIYNDKDREEERKHLPDDLVLGYDNWRDVEDDEGNQMVRLEVVFGDTPFVEKVAFIISSTRELSSSGTTSEHAKLSTITEELQNLTFRVTWSEDRTDLPLGEDEKSICALGAQPEPKIGVPGSRHQTTDALLNAASRGSQYVAEQLILFHLRFDEINHRHDTIRDAHGQTLAWLFDTSEQRSPATLDNWLSSEDVLYWISGKPGSGKSTLMKFLHSDERSLERLKSWTKGGRLIHAAYFFWDAGKSLQKSHEGLLRSLLFDILRQNPDFIPRVKFVGAAVADIPLSIQGLLETLRLIVTVAADSNAKFCFLIDGLDEYEGEAVDMISLISLLKKLPNVKLCVSSRPWNEFEREFGQDGPRTLYMQDRNGPDIQNYVFKTLKTDYNYLDLEDKETQGKALVEEIVQAANGIFLWVYLVLRSFQEGLENEDTVEDLRQGLSKFPRDLNKYFDRILFSDVDDFYHAHSAETFLISLHAEEDLPLFAYWFLREDPKRVADMERKPLAMQQVNKRLKDTTNRLKDTTNRLKDTTNRLKDTTKRLNASSKGLLEVRHLTPDALLDDNSALPSSSLFERKVGFLHRMAREYLLLDSTQAVLQS